MDKTSKWLFLIWAVLAIAAFVGAFFTSPIWVKLIGFLFGAENIMILLSWIIAVIQGRKEYQKQTKDFEKEGTLEKE